MGIRAALGAGGARLLRQVLTESALLGLLGGGVALLLALWGSEALARMVPADLPRVAPIGVDANVLAFTLAIALATGLLFGLAPALRALRVQPQEAARQGGRGAVGGRPRLRGALLVSEVALALVLLVGAGLMIRSLHELSRVPPGFDPRRVLTAYLSLPVGRYAEASRRVAFAEDLLARVRSTPGVAAAGLARYLPLRGGNAYLDVTLERGGVGADGGGLAAYWRSVSPGYFAAMGIPLRRGRDLDARDDARAPGVAVVSETLASRFWPGGEALGRRLKVALPDEEAPWLQVVGVVGDVLHSGITTTGTPELYVPYAQAPSPFMRLVVRGPDDPRILVAGLKRAIAQSDPDLPLADVSTMEAVVSGSIAAPRFRGLLLGAFAAAALLLAGVGILGVVSHDVSERTREIGVRLALGAGRGDVHRLVVRQGLRPALLGTGIGLAGALALSHLLRSLLFGVSPTDPATFAGVAVLLCLVTLAACWLPARRAARVDPIVALHCD